jgi:hypothetical protein
MAAVANEHVVHEAVGAPLSPTQAGAAIAIGMLSLLLAGVQALLLGSLADEHRLAASGIGLAAMLEALTMGVATGVAGVVLKPVQLRALACGAAVALAACDLGTTQVSGAGVFLLRGLAGLPEGVLLWICIGMIARTVTPERWAGVLAVGTTLAQFASASVIAAWVLPRWHANGAFVFMGLSILLVFPVAIALPNRYAPLPDGGRAFPLPLRGWLALFATLMLAAAGGAVFIYLVPLVHQAGLPTTVAGTANALSLGAQVLGGALATLLAGRIRYFGVFVVSAIVYVACWSGYAFVEPAAIFIGATLTFGFTNVFMGPFLVPMAIEADPSRRSAVQSGAAQLLGSALGPLLASQVVSDANARGVLVLGCVLLALGLGVAAWLHFTHRAAPA